MGCPLHADRVRASDRASSADRGRFQVFIRSPFFLYLAHRDVLPLGKQKCLLPGESRHRKNGRSKPPKNPDGATFCGRYPSIYQSSRFPGLRIIARRAFSPCSGCTAMALAVCSPFTVTGSLGIFTRFPFTLIFIRHLKGYSVVFFKIILRYFSSLCQ